MNRTVSYEPVGVCASKINIDLSGDIIKKVKIIGGCPGNSQAVCRLCEGRTIDDVIESLKGIKCGMKDTSCPDQLAGALEELKKY